MKAVLIYIIYYSNLRSIIDLNMKKNVLSKKNDGKINEKNYN